MGLFDKKFCDICGEKIGLLGNRKLEDGNLCKNCASKLSPWFSERRRSTVEDIRAQLAYREENKEKVAQFNTTRTVGRNYMVFLDEDAKKFCVAQSKDLKTGNPDILDFTQVTGCDLDIDESKHEVYYKDREGKSVSYNPPRYDYSYDFYIHLRVNHPYFDEMKFRINPSSVDIRSGSLMGAGMGGQRPPMSGTRPLAKNIVNGVVGGMMGGMTNSFDPSLNGEYQQYVAMGNELREVILQARQYARDEVTAANAPKTAVTCPSCGASTIPDANGCCEFCGSAIGF